MNFLKAGVLIVVLSFFLAFAVGTLEQSGEQAVQQTTSQPAAVVQPQADDSQQPSAENGAATRIKRNRDGSIEQHVYPGGLVK